MKSKKLLNVAWGLVLAPIVLPLYVLSETLIVLIKESINFKLKTLGDQRNAQTEAQIEAERQAI
ncbi:hypothetical protein ACQ4M3_09340 [Leptolyngbya sp. AN03gr2]|uniref:hypothetical protein n=1 Tax=Leptolyngbya sp. AN03gr2 TaxID=3423364 RepID=UPI003D31C7C9